MGEKTPPISFFLISMKNLITIVIPSYNEENYIYNTLWRISRQKFEGIIRVIVAD